MSHRFSPIRKRTGRRRGFSILGSLAFAMVASCPSLSLAAHRGAVVTIPNTQFLEFISRVNGHRYQISVALPFIKAPPKGYPVVYVIDGYAFFGTVTDIERESAVVVGIGYPEDLVYLKTVIARRGPLPSYFVGQSLRKSAQLLERNYDLTLPATDASLASETLSPFPALKSQNVGGLDNFLRIIEEEIKPRVQALVPINTANQVIFGHSHGGLAALHALFVEPNAFRTFIISSPSIWWDDRKVLDDEDAFAAAVAAGMASPRVFVSVGSEEEVPNKSLSRWGVDPAAAAEFLRKVRMVGNARDLVDRLKAIRGGPGYEVDDVAVFDKEGHVEAAWSALARGLTFAFRVVEQAPSSSAETPNARVVESLAEVVTPGRLGNH